jgi:hypothetical protein
VTVTVAVSPAASVPDIGATTTFCSRPGGSETDQFTLPPEAVSVIEPLACGATSSVAGLTLSDPASGASVVPAPGASPVPVPVLTLGLAATGYAPVGAGAASTLAGGVTAAELRPAVGITLTRAVTLAPAVGPCAPGWPSLPRAGRELPAALGVAGPADGTPWCGGTVIQVTPAATATAVPATAPACVGTCHHGDPG